MREELKGPGKGALPPYSADTYRSPGDLEAEVIEERLGTVKELVIKEGRGTLEVRTARLYEKTKDEYKKACAQVPEGRSDDTTGVRLLRRSNI